MGQRAMCYHLFLCHLFYHSSYCCFPPLHVFYHRLSFCSTSLSLLITAVNCLPPFSLIFDVILDLCYFPVQCLLLSIFLLVSVIETGFVGLFVYGLPCLITKCYARGYICSGLRPILNLILRDIFVH